MLIVKKKRAIKRPTYKKLPQVAYLLEVLKTLPAHSVACLPLLHVPQCSFSQTLHFLSLRIFRCFSRFIYCPLAVFTSICRTVDNAPRLSSRCGHSVAVHCVANTWRLTGHTDGFLFSACTEWEALFVQQPNPGRIFEHLAFYTSRPHIAGTCTSEAGPLCQSCASADAHRQGGRRGGG